MICFVNSGLIDLRAVRTFGVNAKVVENPHGFFGTGLKHGIAGLLRLGCSISLYRGLEHYRLGTKQIGMRNKDFSCVTLIHPDGTEEELSYTLELAKTWEPWQLFRELHCNALDENGRTFQRADQKEFVPTEGETAIVVKGPAIEQAFAARHETFLTSNPFTKGEDVEVHQGSSKVCYYRGVRVMELPRPSVCTYNLINSIGGLTEDRTLRSSSDLDLAISKTIARSMDEAYLEAVLTAPKDTYEHHLSTFWTWEPNETFLRVYNNLRTGGRLMELTPFATAIYLVKHKHLPIPDPLAITPIQQKQLNRAIEFCEKIGFRVKAYEIVVVPYARGGLIAWAQDGKIILTERAFESGIKELCSTLYEEMTHIKTGYKDETRELQTHIMRDLFTVAESLVGEPI